MHEIDDPSGARAVRLGTGTPLLLFATKHLERGGASGLCGIVKTAKLCSAPLTHHTLLGVPRFAPQLKVRAPLQEWHAAPHG
jgi:hypothetical protein